MKTDFVIDERLAQLESDILTDYEREGTADKFHLRLYSADELISAGFCRENIDRIIDSVTSENIEDYFNVNISSLTAGQFGGFDITDTTNSTTVRELIFAIKKQAVKGYLNIRLSSFIYKLKGQ